MIIHTVPMTMVATFMTILFLVITTQSWDTAKYNLYPKFTFVSFWGLFLWMWSADAFLWYLVSISQ